MEPAVEEKQTPRQSQRSSARSVRFHLLVPVNAVLGAAILVFLAVDYRSELAERIEDKHMSLREEAVTLALAVQRLRFQGLDAVQAYVDDVCGRMRDAQSPGHHIALRIGDKMLQAVVHHRASPEMVRAMQQAAADPSHRARFGDHELVVGHVTVGDITVYISEYLTTVRRQLHAEYWTRLAGILALGLLAAIMLDAVLVRVIVRPTQELAATIRSIGEGNLGVQTKHFGCAEYEYLGQVINDMSRALARAEAARQREMERARSIQQHLLPHQVQVPGLDVATLFRPAEEVGGDFYDVLPLQQDRWLFCVADVTGHGVPAAMVAAMLKALVTHAVEHDQDPAEILAFVNRQLCALGLPDHLATMALARWSPADYRLEYASAGHEPPQLLTRGEVRLLPSTGILLGAWEDAHYRTQEVPIARGDRLLLATDGAPEAQNAAGEMFGRNRLGQLLRETKDEPLAVALHRIAGAITRHRGSQPLTDDLTLVAVEFT